MIKNSLTNEDKGSGLAGWRLTGCAKPVFFSALAVVFVTIVAGAIDQYGAAVWGYLKECISLGGSSVWFPLLIGFFSIFGMAWAGCSLFKYWEAIDNSQAIKNSVLHLTLWLVLAIFGFLWVLCTATADTVIDKLDYPSLSGFVRWFYLALHLPYVIMLVLFFCALIIASGKQR